jgi:hypothetical protein
MSGLVRLTLGLVPHRGGRARLRVASSRGTKLRIQVVRGGKVRQTRHATGAADGVSVVLLRLGCRPAAIRVRATSPSGEVLDAARRWKGC